MSSASEAPVELRPAWLAVWTGARDHDPALPSYHLTRFLILRLLGLVYLAAFVSLATQVVPLVGAHGLLPARLYLARLAAHSGSVGAAALESPTIFWLGASDTALVTWAWAGAALSLAVALGLANAPLLAALWALYLSFIHVGQLWYGYGWEIQLAETGFLAIFLAPALELRPLPRRPPSTLVIGLFRWLAFRIMLGAGLIKLRGDPCWQDLSCLYYHFETQPIPNPLSRTLHFLPRGVLRAGVLFNHVTELVAPWLAFGPRTARHVAGLVMVAFQLVLIASGNLSFLNWLTIVPMIACFDDGALGHVLPGRLVRAAEARIRGAAGLAPSRARAIVVRGLVALVAALSVAPTLNLLSGAQVMNTSFEPLALVNTYGAFGTVGRERDELVIEGTLDDPADPKATWVPYELPCKPGDPARRPCVTGPYQRRLDWQIWFAAMSSVDEEPWIVHLVWKLLHADPGALALLAGDPFQGHPPRAVRIDLYRYAFLPPGDPSGAWWTRTRLGPWLPPLEAGDPRLRAFMEPYGWLDDE